MTAQTNTQTTMVNFTIDGKVVSVPKGTTVYNAATQHGIEIPIFCYLDRMPPFGACRMCLVEVEKMPKLQTACTLEATEGMIVRTQSDMALRGREGILEFLLINHPLDCPVCDRGGECPLQDKTMDWGPGESRFLEDKRRFKKPLPLGPVLMLDRERCIQCARCTRFSDLISGDHALEFLDRGYRLEVGTPDGGPAESKFIGNTIKICPVGALTSQVYRFRARPWDNKPTTSTCTLCPVGCSFILDSRDGEIMRTRAHENREVNDIWLCDKGWFGYEFTYHSDRLKHPLIRRHGNLEPASWEEAITLIADKIKEHKSTGQIGALGGNPLTFEENYLFQNLMRHGAGTNHLDHRIGMPIFNLEEEGLPPGMEMTIGDSEELSYAILLGIDLTEEFPVIWLRLRQAINRGAKVLFLGHFAPEITFYLTKTIVHTPGKELQMLKQYLPEVAAMGEKRGKGAIFVGRQYLDNSQRRILLSELLKFQQSKPNLTLNLLEGRGNSMGARLAGMRPDVGPLGKRVNNPGKNALEMIEQAAREGWKLLYIAGADVARKFPSDLWNKAREKTDFLVVQDLFLTETAQQADVVLPSLSFVEKGGYFVNIEGRVRSLQPGKDIPEHIYSDSEIFSLIAQKLNIDIRFDQEFLANLKPHRLNLSRPNQLEIKEAIFQEAPLPSGQLKATFAYALFDQGERMKRNSHLVQLAKNFYARMHPIEGLKREIRDGEWVHIKANGHSIKAQIKLDGQVAEETIVLPLGFDKIRVHDLNKSLMNGLVVEVTPIKEV